MCNDMRAGKLDHEGYWAVAVGALHPCTVAMRASGDNQVKELLPISPPNFLSIRCSCVAVGNRWY